HIHCIAHIINIALQDFLQYLHSEAPDQEGDELINLNQTNIPNISQTPTIKKLRKLISKLRSSLQCRQKLKELCKSLGIQYKSPLLDSKTQWNSTLNMIERAIVMASAINRIVNEVFELNTFGLLPGKWNILKEILLSLKGFRNISEIMCSEFYVTMPLAISTFNLIMDDLKEIQEKGLSLIINEAIKVVYTKLKFYYARSDSPDEEWISVATEYLNEVYNRYKNTIPVVDLEINDISSTSSQLNHVFRKLHLTNTNKISLYLESPVMDPDINVYQW
ncbi:14156_t:CDS:2, partial [Ambispora leptoticha]